MSLARACCNPLQRCLQWACATAAPDQRITLWSCLYGASLVSLILRILVVATRCSDAFSGHAKPLHLTNALHCEVVSMALAWCRKYYEY